LRNVAVSSKVLYAARERTRSIRRA